MLGEVKGTKDCLVGEHIEIVVELQVVDQFDDYLVFTVSKGAELSVFATLHIIRIVRAKLGLIGVCPVQLLYNEPSTSTLECESRHWSP